jgi:hypothetical protein
LPLKILALFKAILRTIVQGRINIKRIIKATLIVIRVLLGLILILIRTLFTLFIIRKDIILVIKNVLSIINRLNRTLKESK